MHFRSLLAALAAASVVLTLSSCAVVGGDSFAHAVALPGIGSAVDSGSGSANAPVTDSGQLGLADGYIPVGDSVLLTDDVPAVTNLDAGLRDALARAAVAAAERDV